MGGKITLLGTGTCQLQPDRMGSSVLVQLDGLNVVYDLGRGISSRLTEAGLKSDDVEHIVFSHFHPDHTSDLIPFLHGAAWSRIDPRSDKDLHVYGPVGVQVYVDRLLSAFPRDNLIREHYELHVAEVADDKLEIGDRTFDYIDLPPCDNRGLRFTYNDKTVAITGDSNFHQQELDFIKDVDIAVIDSGHIEDEDILALAVQSQPKELICSHVYRELDGEQLTSIARDQGYTGIITVGEDLMVREL